MRSIVIVGWTLVAVVCFVCISHFYLSYSGKGQLHEYPSYENPIRSAEEDEVLSLPGLNEPIHFKHYSGYLEGDQIGGQKEYLHYWFVESQNKPSKDPVLLWLNGGPGASSLEGLFQELGPFQVDGDGQSVSLRLFSWNRLANVLFLESPSEVGFSYLSNGSSIKHTDDLTANSNYLALKSFFKKFPQYQKNDLYLSGESYAGVYLPTLGVLVDQDREMNLKGVAIGNGALDDGKLMSSVLLMGYYRGLYGKPSWDLLSQSCCNSQPPSRESCHFNPMDQTCGPVINQLIGTIRRSGINPYNMYGPTIDEGLAMVQQLDEYLNQESVRKAIHIPRELKSWDIVAQLNYEKLYGGLPGGLAPQMKQLIASNRNLTMLMYNGDIDLVCNFLGDEWFLDELGQKVTQEYTNWMVGRQVAGLVKHYEGITFTIVRGAGHMVPQDLPAAAFGMIKKFLDSKSKNVHLELP